MRKRSIKGRRKRDRRMIYSRVVVERERERERGRQGEEEREMRGRS